MGSHEPKAWKNKVKQACYSHKNPFLNKPFQYSFEDLAGNAVQLPQKKVVLIDIWTTWCGPCIREANYLPGLVEYFEGQAFSVVALSFDEDRVAWENYITKNPAEYPNYHIGKQAAKMKQDLGIQSYPRYLLVDTAGNLVDLHAPRPSEQALKERINELLKAINSED